MAKKTQPKRGKGFNPAEQVITRVKMPNRQMGEMFGRVIDIFGNERMLVFCEDGKNRIGRIRGKIKKRVWIRKADLVVINPWEWETVTKDGMEKCEINWRYMPNEVSFLKRNNKIPELLDINNIPL